MWKDQEKIGVREKWSRERAGWRMGGREGGKMKKIDPQKAISFNFIRIKKN